MSIEALWSMHFASVNDQGAGMVIFETGRVFGGDSQYFYLGNYWFEGKLLKATVRAQHYHGEPYSIFGYLTDFTVDLTGQIREDGTMYCHGHLQQDRERELGIVLTRRADLP